MASAQVTFGGITVLLLHTSRTATAAIATAAPTARTPAHLEAAARRLIRSLLRTARSRRAATTTRVSPKASRALVGCAIWTRPVLTRAVPAVPASMPTACLAIPPTVRRLGLAMTTSASQRPRLHQQRPQLGRPPTPPLPNLARRHLRRRRRRGVPPAPRPRLAVPRAVEAAIFLQQHKWRHILHTQRRDLPDLPRRSIAVAHAISDYHAVAVVQQLHRNVRRGSGDFGRLLRKHFWNGASIAVQERSRDCAGRSVQRCYDNLRHSTHRTSLAAVFRAGRIFCDDHQLGRVWRHDHLDGRDWLRRNECIPDCGPDCMHFSRHFDSFCRNNDPC